MKKITLLLVSSIISILVISQTPQAFKYQAVVRDNLGEIIANQEVSFRISIRDASAAGIVLYQEIHDVTTNEFGLVSLEIGNGDPPITGFIKDIDWGTNDKFMEVELDPDGNTAYVSMGTTQLLAVPYALYSETTGDTSRWRKNVDDLFYLNGKVGIGTISPQYNLDIYGNATGQSRLRLTNPDNSKILLFGSGNDLYNSSITFQGGDALRFMYYDGGYSELMRIQSNGNLGIGTGNPDESALLELNSNSKGFLLPRMTSEEISNIYSPADGLQIYNTDNGKLFIFVNSLASWQEISYGTSSLPTVAVFEIGTGGSCNNTVVNGLYETGNLLTSYEFVTIDVSVTFVGDYLISSDTINGISFSDSGTFTTDGIQTIDLMGSGTPINGQIDIFTAATSNDGGFCTFTIAVQEWLCGDTLFDIRDSTKYTSVLIGTQCWMAENLNTGTFIEAWVNTYDNDVIEKYCYDDLISNCDIYGGIYEWNELMQYTVEEGVQGICPPNWHIPTDPEWCILENEVDTETFFCTTTNGFEGTNAGLNLKSESGWYNNGNGLDLFGFTALPAGFHYNGSSIYISERIGFWTSTSSGYLNADLWLRILIYSNNGIYRSYTIDTDNDFYVRCLKD